MRTNKKNHAGNKAAGSSRTMNRRKDDRRKNGSAGFKKDSCANIPEEEILAALLSEIFGENGPAGMTPIVGVIELDEDNGLRFDLKKPETEKNNEAMHQHLNPENMVKMKPKYRRENEKIPVCDDCGEEVFLSMLADLNAMMKIVLEQDHMMKMVCEEGVNPEDARCITYLGVHEGREILKKWNEYRNCSA